MRSSFKTFATGVCCTASKLPSYRFTDINARRDQSPCLSSCITQDGGFHPLIPPSNPQLPCELGNVSWSPCLSALFPTVGLSRTFSAGRLRCPPAVAWSGSAVGLSGGSNALGVTADLRAVVQGAEGGPLVRGWDCRSCCCSNWRLGAKAAEGLEVC